LTLILKSIINIVKRLIIPIFSLGSGPYCDGIYLFECDLRGTHDGHYPKHSKKYLDIFNDSIKAFKQFKKDVEDNIYPDRSNMLEIEDKEFEIFVEEIEKKPEY